MKLIACMTLPLLLAGLVSAAPQEAARPPFKDDLDVSIRWLRGQQDRASGAYGSGVEDTALVLIALADSPRAYRLGDGPFVDRALAYLVSRQGEDGGIADEGADETAAHEQTVRAAQALTLYYAAPFEAPLRAALATLDEGVLEAADAKLDPALASAAAAASLGTRRLAARKADASWGDVHATALAIIELSRIEAYLDKQRPRTTGETRALPEGVPADAARVRAAQLAGAHYLAGAAVAPGRWGAPGEPNLGITGMVLGGLLAVEEPRPEEIRAQIDAGLAWLVANQREDGSIHDGQLPNYVTSAAVLALTASGNPEYAPVIERARAYLKGLQADEDEGYSEGDRFYGGIGYGDDERPDLSNLQMALEALSASGLESADPTYTKALRFLERCQNRSESNDVSITEGGVRITSGEDGGAGYMPGDSKAGFVELADGTKVPRSYGSMTYALLKCYVLAGLAQDDPRLAAAWKWCQENYTLDVNPGFTGSSDASAAYQGLFYYYLTLARALAAYGTDTIIDAAGREHAWRTELAGRLVAMQSRIDGSWKNQNASRWLEGNPLLATAYALQTLGTTLD